MLRRINVDVLDAKIQEFFKGIPIQDDMYLLESNGKPLLGLVSPEELETQNGFDVLNRIWAKNVHADWETVERDVAEAVAAVRNRNE